MYVTYSTMVIHSRAKQSMTMLKDKQEANGPHCSPEITVKINKHI